MAETETQIAERIAQRNAPEPEVESPATPEEPRVDDPLGNNLPLDNMVLRDQLFDYFDVNASARSSTNTLNMVNTIMDWAAQFNMESLTGVLQMVSVYERSLGKTPTTDRVTQMYRYVKIQNQIKDLHQRSQILFGAA